MQLKYMASVLTHQYPKETVTDSHIRRFAPYSYQRTTLPLYLGESCSTKLGVVGSLGVPAIEDIDIDIVVFLVQIFFILLNFQGVVEGVV